MNSALPRYGSGLILMPFAGKDAHARGVASSKSLSLSFAGGSMESQLPIACTLTPEELRHGRQALLPGVIARSEAHEPLADGFRFRFKSEAGLMPALA